MEDRTRSERIKDLELMLASCRDQEAALVREALGETADQSRRIQTLIMRAAVQARVSGLVEELHNVKAIDAAS